MAKGFFTQGVSLLTNGQTNAAGMAPGANWQGMVTPRLLRADIKPIVHGKTIDFPSGLIDSEVQHGWIAAGEGGLK